MDLALLLPRCSRCPLCVPIRWGEWGAAGFIENAAFFSTKRAARTVRGLKKEAPDRELSYLLTALPVLFVIPPVGGSEDVGVVENAVVFFLTKRAARTVRGEPRETSGVVFDLDRVSSLCVPLVPLCGEIVVKL